MTVAKELKPFAKRARKQGWQIVQKSGSHLKWIPPQGRFVVTACSPSDHRAIKNVRADLRAAGLEGI